MVTQACDDPLYLKLQQAYHVFIQQSFQFLNENIAYAYQRRQSSGRKQAIIMDADGVFFGEGCLIDHIFTCAVDFVKAHHAKYGSNLPIFIITARTSKKELQADLSALGLRVGHRKEIEAILFDGKNSGTDISKLANREAVRKRKFEILASIGDNTTDLVDASETNGYADTINLLLPNFERHLHI